MTAIVLRADVPSFERAALHVLVELVEGSDVRGLSNADARRLFPGGSLTGARLNRLRNWPRVVVRIDDAVAGIATYTQTPFEMQIPDFAVSIPSAIGAGRSGLAQRALNELLHAVEVASLAGGCHRIVVIPAASARDLGRRGYAVVRQRSAGAWMEKSLC